MPFIGGLFSFLSNPLVVLVLALGGAWMWHQADKADAIEEHDRRATAARQAAVSEFVVGISERETKRRAESDAERGRIQTETKFLQSKVSDYVSKLADSRCVVPLGFVQHHDAAWGLRGIPAASSGLVDQPSGVLLSDVERANTCNAGLARSDRAEVLRWRQWYVDNKAKYDAFARSTDPRAAPGQPAEIPPTKERK